MSTYVDEFRGTDHLVFAEVLTDNATDGYTTGAVKVVAGKVVSGEVVPGWNS